LLASTKEILNDPMKLPTDVEELLVVKGQLTALREQYVLFEKFNDAQAVQRLIRSIDQKLKVIAVRESEKQIEKGKYAEVRAVLERILTEWNAQFDEFLAATEGEVQALQAQHMTELERYDFLVPEELTPHYRKHSSALIELRGREHALAVNEQFRAAQRLKLHNDAAENRENRIQFERMQIEYGKRRERLLAKQNEQMRVLIDHAESTRQRLVRSRDQLIEGHVKRIRMIGGTMGESDEVDDLPEERKKLLEEIEAAYPLPLLRGSAFSIVRQKLNQQRNRKESGLVSSLEETVVEPPENREVTRIEKMEAPLIENREVTPIEKMEAPLIETRETPLIERSPRTPLILPSSEIGDAMIAFS
jgi:hypothetical protein